jgi:hypothetical protein
MGVVLGRRIAGRHLRDHGRRRSVGDGGMRDLVGAGCGSIALDLLLWLSRGRGHLEGGRVLRLRNGW